VIALMDICGRRSQFFNTAYAAAMALTLAAITFIVSLPYLRLTMRQRA
jgi:ABC-type sugar transport system permease subunit